LRPSARRCRRGARWPTGNLVRCAIMRGAVVEKPWIGREAERLLVQPVEDFVGRRSGRCERARPRR
jgi:hypothetical protein